MELLWMRPARVPVRPRDVADLSSPARRVLESLQSRFLPYPVCIPPPHQVARARDQPVPFFGLSATPQWALSQVSQLPGRSVFGLINADPFELNTRQRPEGTFVPENVEIGRQRREEEGDGVRRPCEAGGSHVDNSLPTYDASDDEPESSFLTSIPYRCSPKPNIVANEPKNDHLSTILNMSHDLFEEDFTSNSIRMSPGRSSPISTYENFAEKLRGDAPRLSPDSPPFSAYGTFDDDASKSFNDICATYPESPLNNIEITMDEEEINKISRSARRKNSGDLLESMYAEADKENRRSEGDGFNNSSDLLEHIYSTIRKESLQDNETSFLGSPLKDITGNLNETNIKVNRAPAPSPQRCEGIPETNLLNCSLDEIFNIASQNNVSEKSCHPPEINESPNMAESPNGKITPKTRKKFLGTPFRRALSSNCISSKVTSDEMPQSNIEETSHIRESKKNEMGQIEEFSTPFQAEVTNIKVAEVLEPEPPLFPIFIGQCKRKMENLPAKSTTSCKKKLKFVVPYKKNEQDVEPLTSSHKVIKALSLKLSKEMNSRKPKIQNLTEILAQDINKKIVSHLPEEISMTLQYRGGFCQLNKPNKEGSLFPENILVRIMWSSDVIYLTIPIQKYPWSSALVKTILRDKSRKVCFEAQEMIQLLMDKFGFSVNEVSSQWVVLDPLIGCWLMNPDDPPNSFKTVLTMLKISEESQGFESLLSKLSESAKVLYELLSKNGLWKLFLHIEMHITSILACMELHGIKIDVKKLQHMGTLLRGRLEDVQKSAYKAAGREFQLTSPQQLGSVMYDHLKLDVKHNISVKETDKKHNKSTSEPTLTKFKDLHPLPGVMLEFRRLHKLKSTYVDSIIGHASGESIYASWDQRSAATGRITSSEPNLQTIPKYPIIPDQPDLLLRAGFVAREGYSFLAADFQHIELRVFAHLSKDTALIGALSQSTDVFKILSQKWLQIEDISRVSEEDRDKTKRIMYALMYGAGASKLMEFLHIDYNQANEILKKFSSIFPKMEEFAKSVIKDCRSRGYLTTETGRRRLFPNINSSNYQHRMYSERQAVNFLVQGTAADLCKCAMVHTQRHLAGLGSTTSIPQARLLLQIHDELLWEVPDSELTGAADIVQNAMEGAISGFQFFSNFSVPLPVVMKIGKSWGDLKTVKNVSLGISSQQI